MQRTRIEWTDMTWNPIRPVGGGWGCTKISPGCTHCYAETLNRRFGNRRTFSGKWEFRLLDQELVKPLHLRKPQRIFVMDMGDLFHEEIPDRLIDRVFDVILQSNRNTYQILTKRPERMCEFLSSASHWPINHVWLGVSAEDQQRANERVPVLLEIPASVHFASCEPLLGPVDLTAIQKARNGYKYDSLRGEDGFWTSSTVRIQSGKPRLNLVIVGGESGPKARPMHYDWVRGIRDQCHDAGIPLLVKQMGRHPNKKSELGDIPSDLRIREFPNDGDR